MVERLCAWLHRWRFLLGGILLVHHFVLHFLFIGMPSWDGFSYRVPPIVELVQHGRFNFDHYNQWAFLAYVPFVELVQTPFVWLFKLPGVLVGFPLLLLPLCIVAIYKLVRQLTGDATSAFFGASAYVALPLVNEEPFAGYVDFAVSAALSFYLYSLLRAAESDAKLKDLVRVVLATAMYTLCRGQAVYAASILFCVIACLCFIERTGLRIRLTRGRTLARTAAAFGIGAIPSLGLQVWRYYEFGGPIFPYQVQILGRTFGKGLPMKVLFTYAGIPDDSFKSLAKAFVDGWLWPSRLPPIGFYDSRHLGAGLVLWLALALSWFFVRGGKRATFALVGVLTLLSLLARDYCHPRWASSLILAVVVVVGTGMATLARAERARWLFWPVGLLLFLHAFRPEAELLMLKSSGIGPRMNASASSLFVRGPDAFDPWPDMHARLLIIQEKGFVLPVYGTKLTNEVITTIPGAEVGPACERIAEIVRSEGDRKVLVVDDLDFTKHCERECVLDGGSMCNAWRIGPKSSR